jgi:hypothetical protein
MFHCAGDLGRTKGETHMSQDFKDGAMHAMEVAILSLVATHPDRELFAKLLTAIDRKCQENDQSSWSSEFFEGKEDFLNMVRSAATGQEIASARPQRVTLQVVRPTSDNEK